MTKEAQFAQAWANCWAEMDALKIPTVRMRREADRFGAVAAAHRILSGRRCSDGFQRLIQLGHWNLSLEALVLQPQWAVCFAMKRPTRRSPAYWKQAAPVVSGMPTF